MKRKIEKKMVYIVVGIVAAIALFVVVLFVYTGNRAISLEEKIAESYAAINLQEKRRADLYGSLADTAERYAQYEQETLALVTEMRAQAKAGNTEGASHTLDLIVEAYPTLTANQPFIQMMNELPLTENRIAEYRENYNYQVEAYRNFVRKYPACLILKQLGYEVLEIAYTEYDAPEDAPILFGR